MMSPTPPQRIAGRQRPRTFYRGTDPSWTGSRIRTGDPTWDACLFVASEREKAALYGPVIDVYEALPEARIVYEGSREFRSLAKGLFRPGTSLLSAMSGVIGRAAAAGYDAVWFERQGDTGTAVIRPEALRHVRREFPERPAEQADDAEEGIPGLGPR